MDGFPERVKPRPLMCGPPALSARQRWRGSSTSVGRARLMSAQRPALAPGAWRSDMPERPRDTHPHHARTRRWIGPAGRRDCGAVR